MTSSPDSSQPIASDDLQDAEYKAIGDFRRALREFLAFSDAAAREHDLTSQQHQALLAIRSHSGPEPMSIGELADCLLIRNHSAIELVGRLVDRDLVARAVSHEDRRKVLLTLRPGGLEALRQISLLNRGEYSRTTDFLSEILRRVRALAAEGKNHGRSPTKARRDRSPGS